MKPVIHIKQRKIKQTTDKYRTFLISEGESKRGYTRY